MRRNEIERQRDVERKNEMRGIQRKNEKEIVQSKGQGNNYFGWHFLLMLKKKKTKI